MDINIWLAVSTLVLLFKNYKRHQKIKNLESRLHRAEYGRIYALNAYAEFVNSAVPYNTAEKEVREKINLFNDLIDKAKGVSSKEEFLEIMGKISNGRK